MRAKLKLRLSNSGTPRSATLDSLAKLKCRATSLSQEGGGTLGNKASLELGRDATVGQRESDLRVLDAPKRQGFEESNGTSEANGVGSICVPALCHAGDKDAP